MPIIFDEPTLTLDEKIRVMQDFTATYRHYEQASAALREANCLRIQFPAVMGPIRDGDLFAGRLGGLPIGFNPQAECQQLGYYLDETEMTRLMSHAESEFQHQALKELRDFWREHITIRRIKDAYNEELLESVPISSMYMTGHRHMRCIVSPAPIWISASCWQTASAVSNASWNACGSNTPVLPILPRLA